MSQKTSLTPLKFKCPNGKSYIPKDNIAKYNFQLNYSPLANHVDKNPGKYCYINDTKFGEVSGCSNETQQTNFTDRSIISKISNDSFTKRLFVYDKNYTNNPPFYTLENPIKMAQLSKLEHFDDNNLYKSYQFQ